MMLGQYLAEKQELVLSQYMQRSLKCLQLPILALREYLQDESLSNPMLELGDPPQAESSQEQKDGGEDGITRREREMWSVSGEDADFDPAEACPQPRFFSDYLNDQLGQMAALDQHMLALCRYLIGCLNEAGYLDCPVSELAQELKCPLWDLEQALFVVQALDPPGVGARDLSECLLLQLAQGKHFTQTNVRLVRQGLEMLAADDYAGLEALLGCSREKVRHAVEIVRGLNPIPSQGFDTRREEQFIVPEAEIRCEGGELTIVMNDRFLPVVCLCKEYCVLLENPDYKEVHPYLREKLADAKSLIGSVEDRNETLFRLLSAVAGLQKGYFIRGESLAPVTMSMIAEKLGMSVSTVSRAVREKYVQFEGKTFQLRKLFAVPVQSENGGTVSVNAAREQVARFIRAEDPGAPLSDEALAETLASVGIRLSRRTVAKYRTEQGIPASGSRKRSARAAGRR